MVTFGVSDLLFWFTAADELDENEDWAEESRSWSIFLLEKTLTLNLVGHSVTWISELSYEVIPERNPRLLEETDFGLLFYYSVIPLDDKILVSCGWSSQFKLLKN